MGHGGHNTAILHNTDGTTAVIIGAILIVLRAKLTVLYQGNPAANRLLAVAQIRAVTDDGRAILQNSKIPAVIGAMVDFAVHDQCAHRLAGAHVEEVSVDAGHNSLTGMIFLIICSLLRGLIHAPPVGIVLTVTCNNFNAVTQLNAAHVVDFLVVARCGVGHDLVLDYTVGDLRNGILNQYIAIRYTGPGFLLGAGGGACQCNCRHKAQQHNKSYRTRNHPLT